MPTAPMSRLDISTATVSNMTSVVTDVTIDPQTTDGPSNSNEVTWQNTEWAQQWGYFNTCSELKSALLMKGCWDVGKGFTADPLTTAILRRVNGWGKDTFTDILFNMDIISRLAGDSFAEVMRDEKNGRIMNLKPLDPGSMRIVCDKKGILLRYEQVNFGSKAKEFSPDKIFHLSHNRLADQIHGVSVIKSMEKTLLAENESFTDLMKIVHRNAKPLIMFKLGTDNQAKINAFIAKMDQATNKGENIYIPDDENTVSYEVVQINVGDIVMAWRNDIRNKFYRTLGLPQIVFGAAGGTTESGGKMEYLAHEQVFEHDQRYIEQQLDFQLGIKINLISPVSLLPALQMDQDKDGQNKQMDLQKSDVTGGAGR